MEAVIVVVAMITLIAIERALAVWLYEWLDTHYIYTEQLWLDILYRGLKCIGAFSFIFLIGMWLGALIFIWLWYWLAFILKTIVYKCVRKENGE